MPVKYLNNYTRKFEKKTCELLEVLSEDDFINLTFARLPKGDMERVASDLGGMGLAESVDVFAQTDTIILRHPDWFYMDENELKKIIKEILTEYNYELIIK